MDDKITVIFHLVNGHTVEWATNREALNTLTNELRTGYRNGIIKSTSTEAGIVIRYITHWEVK